MAERNQLPGGVDIVDHHLAVVGGELGKADEHSGSDSNRRYQRALDCGFAEYGLVPHAPLSRYMARKRAQLPRLPA